MLGGWEGGGRVSFCTLGGSSTHPHFSLVDDRLAVLDV